MNIIMILASEEIDIDLVGPSCTSLHPLWTSPGVITGVIFDAMSFLLYIFITCNTAFDIALQSPNLTPRKRHFSFSSVTFLPQ